MAHHLITSAPPCVTGANYLDDLSGAMLPADVFARYLRQNGHEVLFVCATDDHGAKAELAAAAAKLPVSQYCAQQHKILEDLGERFLLSWDYFGRSSSAENHELTQHFASSLDKNGFVEERETEEVFSLTDNDLEVRKTKHLFLRQSEFEEVLQDGIDLTYVGSGQDESLQDRCITRDLKWGIPVGWPGYEGKVFDISFDSSIEYIGATYEWSNQRFGPGSAAWRSWWFNADKVTYTQFMHNDNLPFRKLRFASTIIGSWEPWKLPDYIKGFDRLTCDDRSFSAADGQVFADPVVRRLSADCWRWFLMENAPETSDSVFTWERFAAVVNSDLATGLEAFVNQSFALAQRTFGAHVPVGGDLCEAEQTLSRSLGLLLQEYAASLSALHFRRAASHLRAIWGLGNDYLDDTKPWTLAGTDPARCATVLRTALNLAHVIAVVSEPVIPSAAAAVLTALHLPTGQRWDLPSLARLDQLPAGHAFHVPDVLFRTISPGETAAWQGRVAADSVAAG
jgi:methionyl-tRNA synthetase